MGAKRSKNAPVQFLNPAITSGFPFITASKPILATASGSMEMKPLNNRTLPICEVIRKFVFVGPGHKQVVVTPLPLSSLAKAYENETTYDFEA